jgi:hypothetical protein
MTMLVTRAACVLIFGEFNPDNPTYPNSPPDHVASAAQALDHDANVGISICGM